MRRTRRSIKPLRRKPAATVAAERGEYQVGPGRPPREFQFKPGQSGNPKGAKRKLPSILPDIQAMLEDALSGSTTLRQGNKERTLSKLEAGIEHLVDQFAQGDRNARRDLIDFADKLGVQLFASPGQAQEKPPETTLTAEDEAVIADFLKQHGCQRHPDPAEPPSDGSDPPNSNSVGEPDEPPD
jgi:uncharacterized protein DUF5681